MRILGKMIKYGLIGMVLYVPFTFSLHNPRAQTIVHLATLMLFLLWLLKLNGERTSHLVKTPLYLPLLLLLILCSISVVKTNFFYYSTQEFFRITTAILFFFLVANNTRKENKFILPLILAANVVALIGIQGYFCHSFPYAISTLPNHNFLAGYLVVSISLALGLFLFSKASLPKRIPFLLLLVLPFICFILAKSRGGLLSLMAALFILILAALNRQKRWLLAILSLLIILLLFTPNPMMKRLIHIGEEDPHAYERLLVWRTTIDMIKDYPLLGTGLGTFRDYYPQYKSQIGFRTAGFAHNEYLQCGAELGLIGLTLVLWLLILFFRHSKRLLFQKESGISIALVSSMVAILVHSLVDFNLHTIPITTTFFYLLGLSVSSQRVIIRKPARSPHARKGIALLVIVVTLLYGTFLIQPYLARLHWKRGNLYLERGKRKGALSQYQRAIALQPRCPLYHKVLANLYWEEEYLGRALMEYKKAVNFYPRNVFYHRALGKFYEEYKLWEEARGEYQKMVFLAPKVADFQLDLGRIYLKEGKYLKAEEIYQKVLLLDPDNRIAKDKTKEIAGFEIMAKEGKLSFIIEFILLALIIFRPFVSGIVYPWSNTLTLLIILFFSILWLGSLIGKRKFQLFSTPLNLPLFSLLLIAILSTIFSLNRGESLPSLYQLASYLLFYLLIVNHLSWPKVPKTLALLLTAGFFLSLYAIYQYRFALPHLHQRLDTITALGSGEIEEIRARLASRRVFSTFVLPSGFAGYLALVTPLAIGSFISRSSNQERILLGIVILTMLWALFLTFSLGGILALVLASFSSPLFLIRKRNGLSPLFSSSSFFWE